MMMRSKTVTEAIPKVNMCSMIDPIHIHEVPRLCFNFVLNSVSLPLFYAISVFQRELEFPALPLESVLELFVNGSMCSCCARSGRLETPDTPCTLGNGCHTSRVRDAMERYLERRAFLPRESGTLMRYDCNAIPYITAYGSEDDRCDMSTHASLGRVRQQSCMRARPTGGRDFRMGRGGADGGDGGGDDDDGGGGGGGGGTRASSRDSSEVAVNREACSTFCAQCFHHYAKPFADCAMITEGEFFHSMGEMMGGMTSKFAQFFGDLPFFGKHATVMRNLGIRQVPSSFVDLTRKQVFEQGQPIIRAR
jgi:hypothetical protein